MDLTPKTLRKRVANFTADEKALLAQLIKKRSIVESKLTDGKSVAKKQEAWELITHEFNSNAHVHKRETITLKRAWNNMKSFTRKAQSSERGHLIRTGGGPQAPLLSPQTGAIVNMIEEMEHEKIKKQAAILLEKRNRILLEKAEIELQRTMQKTDEES